MWAAFMGCIHPYTGRSVDQLLVLKQEMKTRARRSMWGVGCCWSSVPFHSVVRLLRAFKLFSWNMFLVLVKGEKENRGLLTCLIYAWWKTQFRCDTRLCFGSDVCGRVFKPQLRFYTFYCLLADTKLKWLRVCGTSLHEAPPRFAVWCLSD